MIDVPSCLKDYDAILYLVGHLVREGSTLEAVLVGMPGLFGGEPMRGVVSFKRLADATEALVRAGSRSEQLDPYSDEWATKVIDALNLMRSASARRNRFVHDVFLEPPDGQPGIVLYNLTRATTAEEQRGPVVSEPELIEAIDEVVAARNAMLRVILDAPWNVEAGERLGRELAESLREQSLMD